MQLTSGYHSRGVQEDHAGSEAVIIGRKKTVGGATVFLPQEDRTELAFYWYCILIASISPSHTERGGREREKERLSASFTSQIRYSRYPTHLSTADQKKTKALSVSLKLQRIIKFPQ